MAKPILFLTAVFMSLCLMSCDLETTDNGKLDGFWHLERIDTLATGGSLDTSGDKVFWSFQVRLLWLQGGSSSFYFRFNQDGDSLSIYSPYTNEAMRKHLATVATSLFPTRPYCATMALRIWRHIIRKKP